MKSEHRHELKRNDLAEWLANFPDWAKQNRNTIIYLTILFAVVIGLWIWQSYSKNVLDVNRQIQNSEAISSLPRTLADVIQMQSVGSDTAFRLSQEYASILEQVVQSSDNKKTKALALIKKAQAIRSEMHFSQKTVSSEELNKQITLAKQAYTKALSYLSDNEPLAASAKFGIGLCEEELKNFDDAKKIYTDVSENENYKGNTVAFLAQFRLKFMDAYKDNIKFKPAPIPLVEPLFENIDLTPADMNLPVQ
jgi:hypothetical protein